MKRQLGVGRQSGAVPTKPKISVVIPTFREAENLRPVAEAVYAALAAEGLSHEILFVDDDSRDGSEDVIRQLARSLPVQMIVRRAERGLATAVIRGIESARGRFVVVMDADLSHPADRIPQMVRLLEEEGRNFVIGSRYVCGGEVDPCWSRLRRWNSRFATWLARPLAKVHDPMSGFFAFARCEMPDPSELSPVGYKIGLELLVKGRFDRPAEIPILFSDRVHGESKLSLGEQLRYLQHLNRLYKFRYRTIYELAQFGFVGATGFLVDLVFYMGLQWAFAAHHLAARAVSFWIAATWNWAWNRKLTFASRPGGRKRVQWPAFLLTSCVGFALSWGTYHGLTEHVPFFVGPGPRIFALFLGVLAGMGVNFALARAFVFRPRRSRNPGKQADTGARVQKGNQVPAVQGIGVERHAPDRKWSTTATG